jgi:uncharacterized membrane protein
LRRLRRALVATHIMCSVALLGEVWGLVALNLYATATIDSDRELARSAYRLMEVLVFAGGIPLSLLALVTGVVLAVTSHWGLVRHYWVFTKLLLLIAVILSGMLLFQPAPTAAAIAGGSVSDGQQVRQVAVVAVQLGMLGTATVLAVFKPRRRIGWWPRR